MKTALAWRLKTLADHERERAAQLRMTNASAWSMPNGIACPACGAELSDTGGTAMPAFDGPPRLRIFCPSCRWCGTRTA